MSVLNHFAVEIREVYLEKFDQFLLQVGNLLVFCNFVHFTVEGYAEPLQQLDLIGAYVELNEEFMVIDYVTSD